MCDAIDVSNNLLCGNSMQNETETKCCQTLEQNPSDSDDWTTVETSIRVPKEQCSFSGLLSTTTSLRSFIS